MAPPRIHPKTEVSERRSAARVARNNRIKQYLAAFAASKFDVPAEWPRVSRFGPTPSHEWICLSKDAERLPWGGTFMQWGDKHEGALKRVVEAGGLGIELANDGAASPTTKRDGQAEGGSPAEFEDSGISRLSDVTPESALKDDGELLSDTYQCLNADYEELRDKLVEREASIAALRRELKNAKFGWNPGCQKSLRLENDMKVSLQRCTRKHKSTYGVLRGFLKVYTNKRRTAVTELEEQIEMLETALDGSERFSSADSCSLYGEISQLHGQVAEYEHELEMNQRRYRALGVRLREQISEAKEQEKASMHLRRLAGRLMKEHAAAVA